MLLDPALRITLTRYLPAELVNQLPEQQAISAAVRRLSSLQQAVSSFLPQYIAENERLYTEDHGELRPGTFLFADVSGFTALSEKLQREGGREGTDILTEVISNFFSRMLEILAKSNGQLLKFAGDALLTFFPATGGEDEGPFAIRTGLRMQREMTANFQPISHPVLAELFGDHNLELTMSIGVCRGKLFEAVVGNTTQRDHVIQGDLPGRAMAAEAAGERDDVIITADLQRAYAGLFETRLVGDDFFQVIDNFGDSLSDYEFVVPRRRRAQTAVLLQFGEENPLDDLRRNLARLDGVARFVARDVVDRLAFKGDRMESDNRLATVIFAYFAGFADLLARWGDDQLPVLVSLLNRYYNLMQHTIVANGGTLARTDPYQRGVKMLVTFGAPVAHPDDPERAVTTALEMNRQLADFNSRLRDELAEDLRGDATEFITQRVGVAHGMTFAGLVGPLWRREYTVMGDDVNLAARLMAKGQTGQILISERVWERVHPHFDTEALPPFQLKGKSKPTQAYLVRASTASALQAAATSDTPFAGRDLQLLALTYGLQQAKGPRRRQVFALCAEAGVGKTRMARQVVQAAEASGFRVAWANCQLGHAQDQSVWAGILFQLLQLDQARSEPARRRLLQVRLEELGLGELDAVFSMLLFGSAKLSTQELDRLTLQTPDGIGADMPKREANVFDLARAKTDLDKSGIFGIARDQLKVALDAAASGRPMWQAVQKQTSLPDALVRFIQAHADRTPTLLVIDDLHRADPPAMVILKRVLAEISRAQLVILLAYEQMDDEELGIRRRFNLADLDEAETTQMAMRVLQTDDLGPRLRALIWERTKGRPLFIESLLRLLHQDQQLDLDPARAELRPDVSTDALPDNVRELITSQLDRLSPEANELLQVASVLGDGFSAETLIQLTDKDNQVRLEALLGEMIFQEIIEPLADGSYRFRHGLAQMTVYESLNRLQRQKIHRAAADLLQKQDDAGRNVLKVVYHLVKGGMPLRGIELVANAAERAEQAGQLDRAIELYTHAQELFPHDDSIHAELGRLHKARG